MDVRHAGFDKAAELELRVALADFDSANVAGPVANILEQVVMNGSQMAEIEMAGRRTFDYTLCNQPPFDLVKGDSVCNAKPIPKNLRSRVDVRIVRIHFVAESLAFAMI